MTTSPKSAQDLLTPAMRDLLKAIAKTGRPPTAQLTYLQARQANAQAAGILEVPAPPMARDETLHIPTRDGATLRAKLWAASTAANLPVLLYFHGGGFTIGSPEVYAVLCKGLAQEAQCAVLAVDYRLAPEHTFPTAHQDAFDSLQWLHAQAAGLGLDATRIALGGDSAGGSLTAATAIAARDAGLALRLQLMFYPGCAPAHMASANTFATGFLLEKNTIDYFYQHYLPQASDRSDPRFSPLLADVDGVAPAWLGLAECDPLVDEGVAYADHLRAAGVAVDLEIYRGVIHSFIQMSRVIPEALQARADAARALRQAFLS